MNSTPLSTGRILGFWTPLMGTWLLMAVDGPLLTALIARMAHAELNLAAYGVAFSFALVAEAPIIMLMSASTALASGPLAYRRLRNFTAVLTLGVTLIPALLLLPWPYRWLMEDLIGLSPQIAARAHWALLALIPWAAAIGLNDELVLFSRWPLIFMALLPAGSVISSFQRGILLEGRLTRPVSTATLVEATVIFGLLTLLLLYTDLSGALCAALAYVVGRCCTLLWMIYPCRLVLNRVFSP